MIWKTLIGGLGLLLILPSCTLTKIMSIYGDTTRTGERGSPLEIEGFDARAPQRRTAPFAAGAGIADITPPPGFPMGGHGPSAEVARGYWLGLRARAFFFEDRDGRTLTLVSADLFAIPAGLRANVAAIVNAEL